RIGSASTRPNLAIAPQHTIEIEQDFDAVLDLREAEQVRGRDAAAELRRLFDFRLRHVQHFRHGVDHHTHHHAQLGEVHVHDDDARPLAVLGRGKAELAAQVDDGNHFAAQVDDAQYVVGHLRHLGDVHHLDDLAHLQNRYAVLLVAEREGQKLA